MSALEVVPILLIGVLFYIFMSFFSFGFFVAKEAFGYDADSGDEFGPGLAAIFWLIGWCVYLGMGMGKWAALAGKRVAAHKSELPKQK